MLSKSNRRRELAAALRAHLASVNAVLALLSSQSEYDSLADVRGCPGLEQLADFLDASGTNDTTERARSVMVLSAGERAPRAEWARAQLAAANHIDELIDLLHQAVPLLRWRWLLAQEVRHQIAAWTRLRKVLTRRTMNGFAMTK